MTYWDGKYTNQFYELTTKNGHKYVCWPNDGTMDAVDGSGHFWTLLMEVTVKPIGHLKELKKYMETQ